ncbi:MAG: hypothetical protein NXI22_14645 [bacterium]|nr:hypothetical protein [bacterium]
MNVIFAVLTEIWREKQPEDASGGRWRGAFSTKNKVLSLDGS